MKKEIQAMTEAEVEKDIDTELKGLNIGESQLILISLKLLNKYHNSNDVIKQLEVYKCPGKLKVYKKRMLKVLRKMKYEQMVLN